VVSATGEVMPCTTTDLRESQGNVRDRRLSEIWADGFRPFRSGSGIEADCDDCWLNTRHGHSCRPAFTLDLFEPDGRRLIPLLQVRAAEGVLS
jgi:radical SAM protein with 4Fe4S-binding SPASM domain